MHGSKESWRLYDTVSPPLVLRNYGKSDVLYCDEEEYVRYGEEFQEFISGHVWFEMSIGRVVIYFLSKLLHFWVWEKDLFINNGYKLGLFLTNWVTLPIEQPSKDIE